MQNMDQQQTTTEEIKIEDIRNQSTGSKIKDFIKNKLLVILLVVGGILFALKDAINWGDLNEVDIIKLLISMVYTYAFSLYTVVILGKMGMRDGKESDIFKRTLQYFSAAKESIVAFRSLLGTYCKLKTQQERILIQTQILEYQELDINKLYEYKQDQVTKKQWKAIKKARKVKVLRLQEKDLLSERGFTRKNKYGTYLGQTEKAFTIKNDAKNAVTKLIIPIVTAFISVESIVMANVLGGLIKAIIILFAGAVNYLTSYDFATNELRNRFINKADALNEFKELCEQGTIK